MKKVLIIVDTSRLTGRDLLKGAEKYISTFSDWEVFTSTPNYLTDDFSKDHLRLNADKYDGFFICYTKNISSILNVDCPKVVHYTPKEMLDGTSLIVTNSSKTGKMAAEYFISLGFKNFAYCGFKNIVWSDQRQNSFHQTLAGHGYTNIWNFLDTPKRSKEANQTELNNWLINIPKPIAVFACNDDRAMYILEACKSSKISVPEEVAVLGVDNDELVCNLSSPPLSSIAMNFINAGFMAAKHLDQLMSNTTHNTIIEVVPTKIITRKSTDIFAIEDKELISAMIFIRNNYQKPIQISDVVKATSISRRELENRFKLEFKKTIKDEINRLRTEYIKNQLINSREPLYMIAGALEFTDPEHFSRYFKNLTGMSPSEFRRDTNLHQK